MGRMADPMTLRALPDEFGGACWAQDLSVGEPVCSRTESTARVTTGERSLISANATAAQQNS